jgi:hypothetical protein
MPRMRLDPDGPQSQRFRRRFRIQTRCFRTRHVRPMRRARAVRDEIDVGRNSKPEIRMLSKAKSRRAGDESNCSAEILESGSPSSREIFRSFILFVPSKTPLLECDNSPTLRMHPAGMPIFATSFSDETESFPPSAASAEVFRAQALTSTVRHAALSDLLSRIADDIRF